MEKRLACLKKNHISLGRGITLIKATLSNTLVNYMSIFNIPVKVVKKLEQLQKCFLWERGNPKKDHLFKREEFCKPKEAGGLGIGNVILKNKLLLGK